MSRRRANSHPCPTPSKRRYVTIVEAELDFQRQVDNPLLAHLSEAGYAYRCTCGCWHRTKSRGVGSVRLSYAAPTPDATLVVESGFVATLHEAIPGSSVDHEGSGSTFSPVELAGGGLPPSSALG